MHRRRGANAVEFALLLPVFVVLLGGAMELSWLFYQQGAIRTSVTKACRAAAMQDPGWRESSIDSVTAGAKSDMLDRYSEAVGGCSGCVSWATTVGAVPTRSLQCHMRAPYTGLTELLGTMIEGTITDTVTVRLEYQRRLGS